MIFLNNNQDLTASSGIINMAFLESVYHSVIDDAFVSLGRTVTLHLQPIIEQDTATQSLPAPQQYNPFFSRVPIPKANTRNSGTKNTPRDVQYDAQIKVGPMKDVDGKGIGNLLDNEAMITLVIEALPFLSETLSISIEGRRYTIVGNPRPIGFSQRRYIMVKLREIQELENPSSDTTIG